MATTRRIYQGKALWVGPTGAGGCTQIDRVQSVNTSFNITRQNVDQYGQLAALSREIVEQPTVSLEFSYLVVDCTNDVSIGLTANGNKSAIADILTGTSDQKNYYIQYVAEGNDAVGGSTQGYIGVGNGFISNWTTQGAVGGLPSTNVTVEAMNVAYNTTPTINPEDGTSSAGGGTFAGSATTGVAGQVAALRPGDITVTITPSAGTSAGVGVLISDAKIQSYNISYGLTRTPLNKLGSKFAFARPIQFPATATATVSAEIGDLGGSQTSLSDILCADRIYDISVTLKKPVCGGTNGATAAAYSLKGANLDSQNITTSIGANDKIDLTFSTQLSGPTDTAKGVFITGISL
jgi:hypothetical protein